MAATEPTPSLVERLFAEPRSALRALLLRRLRSRADAADLAQEAYVRMLGIRERDAIRSPVRDLYTVAHHLAMQNALLDRRRTSAIDTAEATGDERLDRLPACDGDLDAKRRIARLRTVLRPLRPKRRAAAEMRFTHDLSYREIAIHLRVSPPKAKKCVAQALGDCRRRSLHSSEQKLRAAIVDQASEWLVASDEAPLDARNCTALADWLKTSPIHVEELLGVSTLVSDLKAARADPEYSLKAILARARAEDDRAVQTLWSRMLDSVASTSSGRWLAVSATMAACGLACVGLFLNLTVKRPTEQGPAAAGMPELRVQTRHGPVDANTNRERAPAVHLDGGQRPVSPKAVDAESVTAWLRKEVVFDHEPY